MTVLKLTAFSAPGEIALPPEFVARLNVGLGDRVYIVPTAGGAEITTDAVFAEQVETAQAQRDENREALAKLAK